ncbi:B3 domain-containing protein Os01g0723500-like isoform X1 [Aristolochia californica]|uniref:B3 domain-containing protein Os01g0723500-like isoform X1 n=1 Tax=Aristolochia californica TaxID=171875 RepID=UPI0035DDB57C
MEAGGQEDPSGQRHFFKIMFGNFAQQLRIPPGFIKHISGKSSKRVTLIGPSGGIWNVKLDMRSDHNTYLKDGWQDFVEDHFIQEHDFLVFRYDGRNHFYVQIFDKTACEKEDAFIIKRSKQKSKACEEIKSEKYASLASGHLSQQKSGFEDLQDCPSVYGEDKVTPKFERDVKIKRKVVSTTQTDLHLHDKRHPVSSRRCTSVREENSQISEKTKSFTSKNPCLKLYLTATHVKKGYIVHMPSAFSKKYLPRKSGNMLLRDPEKRQWVVRYICGQFKDSLSGDQAKRPIFITKSYYRNLERNAPRIDRLPEQTRWEKQKLVAVLD